MRTFAVETVESVVTTYYIEAETKEDARSWNGTIVDMKDRHRYDGEITDVRDTGPAYEATA
jgi:hypothetical protein